MGFVRFDNTGRLLNCEGMPVHLTGVNYVASYICSNFWADWRPKRIAADLDRIAQLGLQAVRIPMHWGYMEPAPGQYNPVFEERFAAFITMCRERKLYVMPWFLVGVATNDYDCPYRDGRSFFCEEMIRLEQAHLQHFIAPYKDEEYILFWDICDEPEWYSRHPGAEQLPYDRQRLAAWVQAMYDAIRTVDENHLITLGFGHIATMHYGMDIRDMADVLDLMVVTAYPDGPEEAIDSPRRNYCVPFHTAMNSRGKPTFTCEAPGFSSIMYAEEIVGRYFRTSMYSDLLAGSTGVLPWVYNDFEESLWHDKPLEGYTIEPAFGIVTVDGRLKPNGQEVRDFAAFSASAQLGAYRPRPAETAILVPEGYYPNLSSVYPKLYTAFLQAKGCTSAVDLVWSSEDYSRYKLLIVPSAAGLTTSAWDQLRRYVAQGGHLYFIYTGDLLNAYFNQLFGVEVQYPGTDYGYAALQTAAAFGSWQAGETLPLVGQRQMRMLFVRPDGAQVMCTCPDGTPALLRHTYGQGEAWLMTLPVDSGLMKVPCSEYLTSPTFALLDAIMDASGVSRLIRCSHPAVEAGLLEKDGGMLAMLVSHERHPVQTQVAFDASLIPAGWTIRRYDNGALVPWQEEITLPPAGVAVYRIEPIQ